MPPRTKKPPRTKWQTRYRTTSAVDNHASKTKAYEFIHALVSSYIAADGQMDPRVYVWCTDGVDRDGKPRWVPYEDVDLAEWAAARQSSRKVS